MDSALNMLILFLLVFFIWSRFIPVKGVHQITTFDLREKMKTKNKKTQWIDVRTKAEFTANHIKGFKNIPLHEINQQANKLIKDEDVVLICRSGNRSMSASKKLKKLGFTSIYNVKGGMNQWH